MKRKIKGKTAPLQVWTGPYSSRRLKADSHIPCRSHAILLWVYIVPFPFDLHSPAVFDSHIPCRSHAILLRVYIVPFPFDLHSPAVFDSHIPCRSHAGMVCVNQTLPHCVNQIGKTQSKPLAERHEREQHWNGMVCVNPP
jgi:hypothetical protein